MPDGGNGADCEENRAGLQRCEWNPDQPSSGLSNGYRARNSRSELLLVLGENVVYFSCTSVFPILYWSDKLFYFLDKPTIWIGSFHCAAVRKCPSLVNGCRIEDTIPRIIEKLHSNKSNNTQHRMQPHGYSYSVANTLYANRNEFHLTHRKMASMPLTEVPNEVMVGFQGHMLFATSG